MNGATYSVLKAPDIPKVEAVPEVTPRPFWSVMIPTYNRTTYLARTLKSVLDQAPGPEEMQIEVVDAGSQDVDSEIVVKRSAGDRVSYFRHPTYVDPYLNWTDCIRRARGRWVHILHDDDMVLPGFYAAYRAVIEANPGIVLVSCRAIAIDENDDWIRLVHGDRKSRILQEPFRDFLVQVPVVCPAVVVSRDAYAVVGGFTATLKCAFDWEMWVRLAGMGRPIGYISRPYFLYRMHSGQGTNKAMEEGLMLRESILIVNEGVKRLPPDQRKQARREGYRFFARGATSFSYELQAARKFLPALRNNLLAIRLDLSLRSLRGLAACIVRGAAYTCFGRVADWARRRPSGD